LLSKLFELAKVLKERGLNPDNAEWFADILEIGVVKPELQGQYQSLQNKVHDMQYKNQKLEKDLQIIQQRIIKPTEVENY
jgi:hypothetical protein